MSSTAKPTPHNVAQAAAVLQRGGLELLRQLVGPWVFVGQIPNEEGEADWSFRTLSARSVKFTANNEDRVLHDHDRMLGATKAQQGAFMNTLLIGRASTNDLYVPHSSVSKLHARVRVVSDDELWLSDAGSSNGTEYGGEALAGSVERRLIHGALARFGVIELQTLETKRLVPLLEQLALP